MTCIIGYADQKHVYIAGDSCGSNGHYYCIRKDEKVFRKQDMLFGYTSSFRMGHLLHWKFVIPKHPPDMSTDEYMNTVFIDEVIKCFTDNGYGEMNKNVKTGGQFLVAYDGRIFDIQENYQVGEKSDNVCACGSGAIAALAAFNRGIEDKTHGVEYNLKKSLHIASLMIEGVEPPFKVLRMKIK